MKVSPLKALCQIKSGGTPSKSNPCFWGGDIPWVSPKDMKSVALRDASDHITEEAVKNSATSIVPANSILVVVRSGILAHSLPVAQNLRPVAFNQDIKALTPDLTKVDPDYLFWFVRSQETRVLSQGVKKGATVHSLQSGFIENLQVPLPDRETQRRIVDLLSRAEGIVRLRRDAEKKAAELIPALFLDMFGDPATNPKGWPMKPLQSVAEVGSGNGFPNKYQGKTEGKYPFYKVSDMNTKGNEVEMRGANNYISTEDMKELRAKAFPMGTIIFPKIGAAIATNKKRMLTRSSCFDNNVMGITAGRDLLPTYIHALMASKNLNDFASDSNPPSIRKTTVEAWEVPVPPISIQSAFADRVDAIRSIQNQQSTATAKAQATFDALLAKAFKR